MGGDRYAKSTDVFRTRCDRFRIKITSSFSLICCRCRFFFLNNRQTASETNCTVIRILLQACRIWNLPTALSHGFLVVFPLQLYFFAYVLMFYTNDDTTSVDRSMCNVSPFLSYPFRKFISTKSRRLNVLILYLSIGV